MGVALKHHFAKRTWLPETPVATRDSPAEFVLNLYFQFPSWRPVLACLLAGRAASATRSLLRPKSHISQNQLEAPAQSSSLQSRAAARRPSKGDGPAVCVSARLASSDLYQRQEIPTRHARPRCRASTSFFLSRCRTQDVDGRDNPRNRCSDCSPGHDGWMGQRLAPLVSEWTTCVLFGQPIMPARPRRLRSPAAARAACAHGTCASSPYSPARRGSRRRPRSCARDSRRGR